MNLFRACIISYYSEVIKGVASQITRSIAHQCIHIHIHELMKTVQEVFPSTAGVEL